MSNLALCIKSTGVKISALNKEELLSNYKKFVDLGMSHKKASLKSISDLRKSIKSERDTVAKLIEDSTGDSYHHTTISNAIEEIKSNAVESILPTHVVRSVDELPKRVHNMFSKGALQDVKDGVVKGINTGKEVYIFSGNVESASDAVGTFMHEHIGHMGLKKFASKYNLDYSKLMRTVYDSVKNTRVFKGMVKDYAADLKNLKGDEKIEFMAEEFMAYRAERLNPTQRKKVWSKIRDFINEWLNKIVKGYKPTISMGQINTILEASKNHYLYGNVRDFYEFQHPRQYYVDMAKRVMKEEPAALHWYENHQKETAQVFGKDADLFNILLAITSPSAKVDENIRWAVQTYLYMHGKHPKPGGIFYSTTERKVKALMEGDWSTVEGGQYKVPEFLRGLLGDPNATTHDIWMRRLFFGEMLYTQTMIEKPKSATARESTLTVGQHSSARDMLSSLAIQLTKETDMEWNPKMVQAALWTGVSGRVAAEESMDFNEGMNKPVPLDSSIKDMRGKTPMQWLQEEMGDTPIGELHKTVKIPELSPMSKTFKTHRAERIKRKLGVPVTVNTTRIASKEEFKKALKENDFTILTAENPDAKRLDDTENEKRNKKLMKELGDYEYTPIKGMYEHPENSFIVFGMTKADALRLGNKYGQQSVIHNGNLVYKDGTYNEGDLNKIQFDNTLEDYYSSVNINGKEEKFSIPISFDDKYLDMIHFSKTGETELKEIDPKFMGTGQIGAERSQINLETGEMSPGFEKKSNWWVEQGQPKEAHRFEGKPGYKARINMKDLYISSTTASSVTETKLKLQGFKGWFHPEAGQVRLFEKVPVERIGKKEYEQIKFSRKKSWKEDIEDPEAKKVFQNIGIKNVPPVDSTSKVKLNWLDRVIISAADDLHALKVLESDGLNAVMSGYKAMRMLSSFPTMFNQFLENGSPVYDQNEHWISINTKTGGMLAPLRSLKDEVEMEQFMLRFLAESARELQGKNRENLFGEELEDDNTIQTLFKYTQPAYDANKEVWDKAVKDLRTYNMAVLDFLESAGMIDANKRKEWQREYYIPFTRMIEDVKTGEMKTLYQNAGGKDIKQVIRRLRGGKAGLGDPLQNLITNYSFMLHEGLANIARKKSLGVMMDAGLGEKVDSGSGANIVSIFVKGKEVKIRVSDPELVAAMTNLHADSNGLLGKFFSKPKQWLTTGVTIVPAFRVANFVRDTLHTTIIEKSFTPFIDSIRGFRHAWMNTDLFKEFAASGAAFSGSYSIRDVGRKGQQKAQKRLLKKIKGRAKFSPMRVVDLWEKVGEVSENAARVGLYQNLRKKGESKMEAGYRAKDLLDFYQSGRNGLVQTAIKMVPFLNARIQGLYKIGRTVSDPATRNNLIIRSVMLGLVALAVHAWNADGDKKEEYEELKNYERLQYLNFMDTPLGHIRIPLPFEMGAIAGSIPVFILQYMNGSIQGKRVASVLLDTVIDSFRFDLPQFMKPFIQQSANRVFFTGSPIESMRDEAVIAKERWNSRTSKTARALAKASTGLEEIPWLGVLSSPKRVDQLLADFLGTSSRIITAGTDLMLEQITHYPNDPVVTVGERYITGIGRFVKGNEPAYSTQSQKIFYEYLKEADKLNSTLSRYKQMHDREGLKYLYDNYKVQLSTYKTLRTRQKLISEISKRMESVILSERLSPIEKRDKLNKLLKKRNSILYKTVQSIKKQEIKYND